MAQNSQEIVYACFQLKKRLEVRKRMTFYYDACGVDSFLCICAPLVKVTPPPLIKQRTYFMLLYIFSLKPQTQIEKEGKRDFTAPSPLVQHRCAWSFATYGHKQLL